MEENDNKFNHFSHENESKNDKLHSRRKTFHNECYESQISNKMPSIIQDPSEFDRKSKSHSTTIDAFYDFVLKGNLVECLGVFVYVLCAKRYAEKLMSFFSMQTNFGRHKIDFPTSGYNSILQNGFNHNK